MRGQLASVQCPKSIITADSLSFLEQFRLWKEAGGGSILAMDAKSADAILVLEQEWRRESQHGE
ncbi:MAG TPA: hypothetical protein VLI55_14755 [Bryobacteraceae bacterium]|nr:hypothetical protein [Bryobacteraceae bacterium]